VKNNKLLVVVIQIMVAVVVLVTYYYWHMNHYYVISEDARINGDIYKVSPLVSGKILEIRVNEGDFIREEDIIARLDNSTLPANADLDLTTVKSPVSGLVVKKIAQVGEVAVSGQPIIMLIDPNNLYVTANIEETKISRLRSGQQVDVAIDALPGRKFTGKVAFVGEATMATFSLLPIANSNGNFTKVVQRIPVKIFLDQQNLKLTNKSLMLGMNVVVKIHVL
jgi:multidrug resistance efflux pump